MRKWLAGMFALATGGVVSAAQGDMYVSANCTTVVTYDPGTPNSVSDPQSFDNTTQVAVNTPTSLSASTTYGDGSAVGYLTGSEGALHAYATATYTQDDASNYAEAVSDITALESGYYNVPGAPTGTLATMQYNLVVSGAASVLGINDGGAYAVDGVANYMIGYVSNGDNESLDLRYSAAPGYTDILSGSITAVVGSPITLTMSLHADAYVNGNVGVGNPTTATSDYSDTAACSM